MDWVSPWLMWNFFAGVAMIEYNGGVLGRWVNFPTIMTKKLDKEREDSNYWFADGFYRVVFSEDYNCAFYEGLRMVVDHYLIVQRWRAILFYKRWKNEECGGMDSYTTSPYQTLQWRLSEKNM